ncbi:uncharacterized protein LODBEIA_P18560 [Lodderomyces beijingensis]|uniref:Altered inheritance of mitochondria protein 32 n=1 Tax=Lodderomyces beijingensis TaxID=1775926 RepID=A0ABP0ZHI4_9ASCO
MVTRIVRGFSSWSRPRYAPINWRLTTTLPAPTFDTGCTFCEPTFPPDKQINFDQPLDRSGAIPTKHVMSLTTHDNKMDEFPSRIEDWQGTLAHEVKQLKAQIPLAEGVSVSSIVLDHHQSVLLRYGVTKSSDQLVFLYPEMKAIKFDIRHTDQFMQKYLSSPTPHKVYNPFVKSTGTTEGRAKIAVDDANFTEMELDKDLIVTCGQTERDIRCGILGPLITEEFDKVLTQEGLRHECYVGQITHIGGHAFAGNVLYYPRHCESSRDFIWYGRVFPKDVQGLVEETVKEKKIVAGLFRGDLSRYEK